MEEKQDAFRHGLDLEHPPCKDRLITFLEQKYDVIKGYKGNVALRVSMDKVRKISR